MTTPSKDMQAWLQTDRMAALGQLTAGIAHELNNPVGYLLSNLRSFELYLPIIVQYIKCYQQIASSISEQQRSEAIQALKRLEQQDNLTFLLEDTASLLHDSMTGLHKIKDLVLDLRRFAHPDIAEPQRICIQELIHSSLRLLRNELKDKVTVRQSTSAEPIFINGRPAALSQVLVNILNNACQAIGPAGGTITINSQVTANNQLEIQITDSGPGISEDAFPHLFEPFFTTKGIGQGTGLGLAICHTIMQQHQGQISAFNGLEGGACFVLQLPLPIEIPPEQS